MNRNRKHNRRAVMSRAHAIRRETGTTMSNALRLAWAEAKARPAPIVAVAPQRLPLEAIALDAWALAKKLRGARIEVALRVRTDVGVRVTPRGHAPIAFVRSGDIAGGVDFR